MMLISWKAFITMEIDGIRTSRAYTLSSPVTQRSFYEITVKKSPNGFGSEYMLHQVKEGDMLTASGPAGNFYRVPCVYGKRLVFVAGGSGITPFISMLQTDYEKGDSSFDIDVLYGCSDEDDIMFKETLDALADKGMCRVHYIISNPGEDCPYETGFVTEELIRKLIPDIENCTFYLCGPSVMYRFVTGELENMGVPRRRIRKEVEVPPKNPTGFAGWPAGIDQNTGCAHRSQCAQYRIAVKIPQTGWFFHCIISNIIFYGFTAGETKTAPAPFIFNDLTKKDRRLIPYPAAKKHQFIFTILSLHALCFLFRRKKVYNNIQGYG